MIKPRSKDIADIKPRSDSEFCQPIYKQSVMTAAPSISSDSKYSASFGQPQMIAKHTMAISQQSTIADRRDLKLASKAIAAAKYTAVKTISP